MNKPIEKVNSNFGVIQQEDGLWYLWYYNGDYCGGVGVPTKKEAIDIAEKRSGGVRAQRGVNIIRKQMANKIANHKTTNRKGWEK